MAIGIAKFVPGMIGQRGLRRLAPHRHAGNLAASRQFAIAKLKGFVALPYRDRSSSHDS
jgi:hypothetical protein